MCRPLLLIDIDGVISLFGFDPRRRPPGRFVIVDGVVHFLSQEVAQRLLDLAQSFELVWCSGWEEKADEHLPHALGLPAGLPHVVFPGPASADGRHWKLAAIDGYAGPDRPLAWIDDGHDDTCRLWASHRTGATLLIATEPSIGLTEADADALRAWASGLGSSPVARTDAKPHGRA
jgi:hypothetical protein